MEPAFVAFDQVLTARGMGKRGRKIVLSMFPTEQALADESAVGLEKAVRALKKAGLRLGDRKRIYSLAQRPPARRDEL